MVGLKKIISLIQHFAGICALEIKVKVIDISRDGRFFTMMQFTESLAGYFLKHPNYLIIGVKEKKNYCRFTRFSPGVLTE